MVFFGVIKGIKPKWGGYRLLSIVIIFVASVRTCASYIHLHLFINKDGFQTHTCFITGCLVYMQPNENLILYK